MEKPLPRRASRVLIIEDELSIRDMLKGLLELEGYEIDTAANGLEGIEKMREPELPQAILLDMMMPEASGWHFLDVMRADPRTAKVPVIAITAYTHTAQSVRPDAIIPKPIQLKSLLGTLERLTA